MDAELVDTLMYHMRQKRMTLRLDEEVTFARTFEDERGQHVRVQLVSGKQIVTDAALYSVGRTGATASLNLEAVGLKADRRGQLRVNEFFQTEAPNIYAAGDVIGFPSLASTSGEQGRLAACHAFGMPAKSVPELLPYGIYTIPEISMVGRTEEDMTGGRGAVRGGQGAVPRDSAGADNRRRTRGCSSCCSTSGTASCSGYTS